MALLSVYSQLLSDEVTTRVTKITEEMRKLKERATAKSADEAAAVATQEGAHDSSLQAAVQEITKEKEAQSEASELKTECERLKKARSIPSDVNVSGGIYTHAGNRAPAGGERCPPYQQRGAAGASRAAYGR